MKRYQLIFCFQNFLLNRWNCIHFWHGVKLMKIAKKCLKSFKIAYGMIWNCTKLISICWKLFEIDFNMIKILWNQFKYYENCLKLVEYCLKLSKIVWNNLFKINLTYTWNYLKLIKIVWNWSKLMKIIKNWLKSISNNFDIQIMPRMNAILSIFDFGQIWCSRQKVWGANFFDIVK